MATSASRPGRRPWSLEGAILAPLHWLERSRGWRRRALLLAYLAVGLAVGLALRWLTCLGGLPDIGAPFDVAAFRAVSVPGDRNAFPLYRKASAAMEPRARMVDASRFLRALRDGWSKADPELRR